MTATVTIYTNNAAFAFDVISSGKDFAERVAKILDEDGTAILQTVGGTQLLLSAINIVAIEITDSDSNTEKK